MLVEHIPAVVYAEPIEYDPGLLYMSPQVEQVLGWTAEEWQAQAGFWLEHLHPDDRRPGRRAERRVEQHQGAVHDRVPRAAQAGALRVDPRRGGRRRSTTEGTPLFWQGVMLDITAQKEAQRGLAEAEQRYRALIEHIPAVVYRESPEGEPEKFYISPQVRDLFGYTPEEWTWGPTSGGAACTPTTRRSCSRSTTGRNETKEALLARLPVPPRRRPLGLGPRRGHVRTRTGRRGLLAGIPASTSPSASTPRIRLREAEVKFRTIVEQNQAIFYTQEIDPDDPTISLTTYIAPGNTDLIGYTLEDIEADPTLWRSIVHPDDRERVLSADAESNTSEDERFSMEYRMIAKDGRIVWVQDEARLVAAAGQAPLLAGVPARRDRAQGSPGTARASLGGRARGDPASAVARRDEEHVPAGGLPRPADARSPRSSGSRSPSNGATCSSTRTTPETSRTGSPATRADWTGWSRTCSTWTGSPAASSPRSSTRPTSVPWSAASSRNRSSSPGNGS